MELLLLSFALSMDSAALNMANGARYKNLVLSKILFIAFMLGFFQFLMPLLGYFLGISFAKFISSIDHFIAFFILCFLGFKMLKEACSSEAGESLGMDLKTIFIGAFATSIDALAIGVTLSFEAVNVFESALIIGVVCFALSLIAFYIGKFMGEILKKKALFLGGAILIFLGFKILITHLIESGTVQ
ncbi:manganese efflux pump MntP family protein [Campylobacter concisus]|uniref:manganese efflux pump MntP n=1 Tax=Campylobacter concisus TaxID=199 RepID=UPI000D32441A|nr:manganese efflux pump MntP family protein [Campylobacter concisus]